MTMTLSSAVGSLSSRGAGATAIFFFFWDTPWEPLREIDDYDAPIFYRQIEAKTFISKLSKNPFSSSLNFIRLLRVVITPSVVVERRKRLEAIGSNFRLFQQLFQKDNVHDSHHIVLLANRSQQCWMLHVAPVCGPCCMLLEVVTLT